MARIKKAVLWVAALLLVSAGKAHAATFEGHHLATGIDVICYRKDAQLVRRFHQCDNMEAILTYLRLLEYDGMPKNDPEQLSGDTYRITVYLADGKAHIYHLHADRFLSRDFRPWEKVESDRSLSELLQGLADEK